MCTSYTDEYDTLRQHVRSFQYQGVSKVHFLGTKVTVHGQLLSWWTSFDVLFHRVHSALMDAGLGAYPSALVAGIHMVFLALLYGCELWCLQKLVKALLGIKSLHLSYVLGPVLAQVKLHVGRRATCW